MTEKDWKNTYKFILDNGYKDLSQIEKELLKKAIDESRTYEELVAAVFAAIMLKNSPK